MAGSVAGQLSARAWVEPVGWVVDSNRVRTALVQGNAAASAAAAAAQATGASDAQASTFSDAVSLRAVELTVLARMGDGDTPRQFQKVCMTGM